MKRVVNFLLGSLLSAPLMAAVFTTPTGYWMQYSDAGQKQSIIKIWSENQVYEGKVITGFPINGVPPEEYCTKCTGDLNNHLIQGMTIMTDVEDIGNGVFEGGHILDPNEGSTYHVKLTLLDNGNTLSVRGYILFPLLGRSQTWTRISANQVAKEVAGGYRFKDQAPPKP